MNAGIEGAVVVGELLKMDKPELGHNAATGEYCNMISQGIIDPTKVSDVMRVRRTNTQQVSLLRLREIRAWIEVGGIFHTFCIYLLRFL